MANTIYSRGKHLTIIEVLAPPEKMKMNHQDERNNARVLTQFIQEENI